MDPDPAPLDLRPVIARLTRSLGGQVPSDRIEHLLRDLLLQRFADARVTVYLPVFLYRHALEALRAESGAGSAPLAESMVSAISPESRSVVGMDGRLEAVSLPPQAPRPH